MPRRRPPAPAPAAAIAVALVAVMLAAAAGCLGLAADTREGADDDDPILGRCAVDQDCVLAGPSCCDCPSYALPTASGWGDTCANIDCSGGVDAGVPGTDAGMPSGFPSGCAPLVARCELGVCLAACAPIACETTCGFGFAMDATGCLTCACNDAPNAPTCLEDTDCVQVPADCCGCARGGTDTAVPRASVADHEDGLGCPPDPAMRPCPDVSTCDPSRVPRCLEQQCVLLGPNDPPWTAPPAGACGRPDLPACPAGQVCVLNRSAEAGMLGLGICEMSR